jgi:hypothetical protein
MMRSRIASEPRNAFDQFDARENRLTHALVVTLDKDRLFLRAFLKKFVPGTLPSAKDLTLAEQRLPGLSSDKKFKVGERGLPDALILAADGRAVAIESKVTAPVRLPQLKAHTATIERRLTIQDSDIVIRCVKAILITGDKVGDLPDPWVHVEWSQIYDLLSDGTIAHSIWTTELLKYLEVMERRLSDEEAGLGVRLTRFNGVPFARGEDYSYFAAKRVLRLLVSELKVDKSLSKTLGLPANPATRGAISDQPMLWDFLAPSGGESAFNTMPHFTLGLGRERAEALLTIPNAARETIRRISRSSLDEFCEAIKFYLKHLRKSGALRMGATPRIVMQQRRYLNMRSVPLTDGRIEFDPRLGFPSYCKSSKPRLYPQPYWLKTAHNLLTDRAGNLQFQIGAVFDYRHCPAAQTRTLLDLYKTSWEASSFFLKYVKG